MANRSPSQKRQGISVNQSISLILKDQDFYKEKSIIKPSLLHILIGLDGIVIKMSTKFCNISGLFVISQKLCASLQYLAIYESESCVHTVLLALTRDYQISLGDIWKDIC